jgi:carboxymethylenebutenolidase
MGERSLGPLAVDRSRWLAATILVAATVALGMDGPSAEIEESTETVKQRGRDVVIDIFAPASPGKHPAILALHGHGGVGEGRNSDIHQQARRLAGLGYVALVPHYFAHAQPDQKNGRKNARSFSQWVANVSATISHAAKHSDVDPKRIGLLGFSLGSYVSLAVAARDRRVSAVVENFGALPEFETLDWSRLPPVLSVKEAHKLDELLDRLNVDHEIKIYDGAGHGFYDDDFDDAFRRTFEFFEVHVKRDPKATQAQNARIP